MRIAFDLDGTLIPSLESPMHTERLGLLARLISREQVRKGTPTLLNELRQHGHEIWLYTTSFRSPPRLRLWFASFGVRLDGIINQARHTSVMQNMSVTCSKYPPAFGIELLIDDAEGVRLEGQRHGFSVLRILEDDEFWRSHVTRSLADRLNGLRHT